MSKNRGQTLDRLMGDGDTGVAKLTQHGRRYQSDQLSEYGNDNEQFENGEAGFVRGGAPAVGWQAI
jgi:hypothetical protein